MFLYDFSAKALQGEIVDWVNDLIEFAVFVEISGRFSVRVALVQMSSGVQ